MVILLFVLTIQGLHNITILQSFQWVQQQGYAGLVTEPISILDNSSFLYSVQYGLTDSLAALQAIVGESFINFKVQLVDDNTGELIGEFDDVTYNANSLYHYNNISYQVCTQGIGNRAVRLKLVLNNNFESEYSLSRIFADESVLNKTSIKQISYKDGEVIKSYELSQNYPNPFNPSTTIKFALPVKTNLVIAVYNLIGEKVAEVFKGELEEGYHEVKFDAVSLPSGVYFYRFESDHFNAVKKMVIMK